jgi:L-alanine-DL-glutamate epimerase-like enolase superfamily enzyme
MRNTATAVYRPKNGLTQAVSISGTSAAATTAFADQTRIVVLDATVGCHVHFAGTPVATAADFHLAASSPYPFVVDPGQKVAVIQDSAMGSGTLWVSEVTF